MKVKLKTDRLPLQFILLGYALIGVGLLLIIDLNWYGLIFLVFGNLIIFFRSGVILSDHPRQVREFNGIFGLMGGKWKAINQEHTLHVIHRSEPYALNFLSLSLKNTTKTYKIYLSITDKDIVLASGEHDRMVIKAKQLSEFLNIELVQQ